MCINFLAVLLSVLGILNPTTGALVHNAGSCFVVLVVEFKIRKTGEMFELSADEAINKVIEMVK